MNKKTNAIREAGQKRLTPHYTLLQPKYSRKCALPIPFRRIGHACHGAFYYGLRVSKRNQDRQDRQGKNGLLYAPDFFLQPLSNSWRRLQSDSQASVPEIFEKKASAYLYKLEKQPIELAVPTKKIAALTEEFKTKHLQERI